jgi:hypothetical protein
MDKYEYIDAQYDGNLFVNLWVHWLWPMVTLCIAICAVIFPLILLPFHCYLIIIGQTTNERARDAFVYVSPYSRGCCGNMLEIFCVISLPVSHVHIKHQPPDKAENEVIVNKG